MSRSAPPDPLASPVVILGADTVLAASPATPVQLAHACRALGYDVAFPASWGDELIAAACLDHLAAYGDEPALLCACPYAIERLTRAGPELATWMITLAAPPVATARYLRAVYGARPVHITYAGACPAAADPAIDVRLAPAELFAAFAERGIGLARQPELFDSILPPDRRRFHSLPGGAPRPERLAAVDPARTFVEANSEEFLIDLAQRLLTHQRVLIDLAPQLGCACSGVLDAAGAGSAKRDGARAAVAALEPPRARGPILDPAVQVDLNLHPAPDIPAHPIPERHGVPARPPARELLSPKPAPPRRTPTTVPALRREDGRIIPRAYAGFMRRATGGCDDERAAISAKPNAISEALAWPLPAPVLRRRSAARDR